MLEFSNVTAFNLCQMKSLTTVIKFKKCLKSMLVDVKWEGLRYT